jgi:SAM-dependent MidA family methyltransferase
MVEAPPPLDAAARERSAAVVERLKAAADAHGFVPFDRFMELALYADGVGYYHQPRSPLGTGGDFYTAAHVDPLFAETLAARLRSIRAAVRRPAEFRVVELGPGDGTLADGLTRALGPERAAAEYLLVDRAPARSEQAMERARHAGVPVRVVDSVAALGPFTGAVVANELLDAQPVRRIRWDGAGWVELGVRVTEGRVVPATGESARHTGGIPLPTPAEPGIVVEFSPAAEATIREVADHLTDGAAIVIDFGLEEAELLRAHPEGTVAAVRGHRFLPDPYATPGAADLSAFVNFSRLRRVARAAGLVEVGFRSQAEALAAWGFGPREAAALEAAPSAEERVRRQLAAKSLLFGFDRFRVLEIAPPATAGRLASAT